MCSLTLSVLRILVKTEFTVHRYQPGTLGSRGVDRRQMEIQRLEAKGAMADVDSGDESGQELETTPLKEKFLIRLLVQPSSELPNMTSGLIVYSATGIICKHFLAICSFFWFMIFFIETDLFKDTDLLPGATVYLCFQEM